jgi:thioredoxin-like negative regulator of GroEL
MQQIARDYADRLQTVKIDVDRFIFPDRALREAFQVRSLPLVALFHDGKEVFRVTGLANGGEERLRQRLEALQPAATSP